MNIYLYNQSTTHDKVYYICVTPSQEIQDHYIVKTSWGSRGDSTLKQKDYTSPLSHSECIQAAQELANKKIAKGYTQVASPQDIPQKPPTSTPTSISISAKSYKAQDGDKLYFLDASESSIFISDLMVQADMGVVISNTKDAKSIEPLEIYNTDGTFYVLSSSAKDINSCIQLLVKEFAARVKNEEVDCCDEYHLSEFFLAWAIPNSDKYLLLCSSGPSEFVNEITSESSFWRRLKSTKVLCAFSRAHLLLPFNFEDPEDKDSYFHQFSDVSLQYQSTPNALTQDQRQEELFSCLHSCGNEKRRAILIELQKSDLEQAIDDSHRPDKPQHKV